MVKNDYTSEIVRLLNVCYHYPNRRGVEGISVKLNKGDFVLLVGKTGSGKTTLFRLMSMELQPDSGEIRMMEMKSSSLKHRNFPQWRRQLGIVYQDLRLLNDRSVLENIRISAACENRLSGSYKNRSLRALSKVGMSHKLHDPPQRLSTGEQQRVAIARALVNEPFFLLADEPVSNLDDQTADEISNILYKISMSGTTVLVSTHQPQRFSKFNPKIICLDDGRLIES